MKLKFCNEENRKLGIVKNVDSLEHHYKNIILMLKKNSSLAYVWLTAVEIIKH